MRVDRYLSFLDQVLTPRRFQHSLGVMQVMEELSKVYALDRDRAVLIGLLHDAAKDLAPAQQMALVKEGGIELRHACESDWGHYLHGPAGAYFIHKQLGVTDALILDAITMHTYYGDGKNFNAPISWCLRFSDILEPNRDWRDVRLLRRGVSKLREIVYAGRLDEGALLQTGWLIEWFEEDGKPVHPNMERVYQELSAKLEVPSDFFYHD
jgi:predicted HD superfamily hydrolase involved in NAD metabolism